MLVAGRLDRRAHRLAVSARRALAPYLREPRFAYGGFAAIVLLVLWWGPTPRCAADALTLIRR